MTSLRMKLTVLVLTIIALALGAAVGAVFGAVQDFSGDRNNDTLHAAGRQLEAALESGEELRRHAAEPGGFVESWEAMAERGEIPSFTAVYSADGQLEQDMAYGPRPELGEQLPQRLRPSAADAEPVNREAGWLVRSVELDDGRLLVTAMRTPMSDELAQRVRNVAIGCTLAALAAAGAACAYVVRRQLRPLETIARTADLIGAGELTRRVPSADPRSEVGRLSKALNTMLTQLESSFAAQTASQRRLRQFVADASHELRTPLAAVRGYAELFRRGADRRPEDLATVVSRIESEAARMGSLVDEMLLLARLDEEPQLRREPVDVAALAADAVADAQAVAPDRPLSLEVSDAADGGVSAFGDAERLRQVFGNLLSNVRSHTPDGTPARVRVDRADDYATVTVFDAGPGLEPEHRAHVFDRFYRADPGRARDHGGNGLGLSIVSAIAEAHGGTVSVSQAPEGGAAFEVRLPLSPESAPPELR